MIFGCVNSAYWEILLAQKHLSLWITSLQEEGHLDSIFFCYFHSKDFQLFYDSPPNCSTCCTFNSFLAALNPVSIACEYEILQAFFLRYSSEYFCFFFHWFLSTIISILKSPHISHALSRCLPTLADRTTFLSLQILSSSIIIFSSQPHSKKSRFFYDSSFICCTTWMWKISKTSFAVIRQNIYPVSHWFLSIIIS